MTSLLDNQTIANIDKDRMLETIEKASDHLASVFNKNYEFEIGKRFEGVVLSGMGGSGIAGDVVFDLYSEFSKKKIYVNKGYSLPTFLDEENIFFAISYSGETEETLSALKEAESRNMQIVCVSSGGKMQEIADAKKYPYIEIQKGLQPRAAFYLIFASLIKALDAFKVISLPKDSLKEAAAILIPRPDRSNEAKQIAQKIKDKTPIIFTSSGKTYAAGLRLKNQFNENAKIPAFLTVFPELNHNEMVGFASLKKGLHNFAMILLRDEEENVRISKRIEITKSLIGANLGGIIEIRSKGASRLARILSLIFFSDILSCYTAILNNIDPTPVDVITKLKKELKR